MKRRDWWLMPKEPFWTPSRILSGLIFFFVLAAGTVFTAGVADRAAGMAIAPTIWGLLCIWFPEALGSVSKLGPSGPAFTKETPPEAVYWFGWVMLIVPGILFVVLR